jgi:predicted Zn-dependent protease
MFIDYVSVSECESGIQLHGTRASRPRDAAERWRFDVAVRIAVVRVVRCIEHICTEL